MSRISVSARSAYFLIILFNAFRQIKMNNKPYIRLIYSHAEGYGCYNYFYIARYVISCCAVDSVPMKILVEKNFFIDYPDGTWLTVKGKLSQKVVNGQAEYVITDARADKIDQPKYPYELLGV